MTKKYHINDAGEVRPCDAKIKCDFGGNTGTENHFTSKELAHEHLEQKLAKTYSAAPSASKSKEATFRELSNLFDNIDEQTYGTMHSFFSDEIPDASVLTTVEQIDYRNEALFEKDGETFIATFYGGDWMDVEPLSVDKAEESVMEQIDANLASLESLPKDQEELLDELKALGCKSVNKFPNGSYIFWGGTEVYAREDGSKIHTFPLLAEGDSSLSDKPYPVNVNMHLHENGERQNARMMAAGRVIYDEKTDRGALFVWQSGSEDGGEHQFANKNGVITPDDKEGQSIYLLEGTGGIVEQKYWRRS